MEHVIPLELFRDMPTWLLLVIGGAGVWALLTSAEWLVSGASGMALRAGISKVIIGATIVSLGTTSPECAVSVVAAWSGDPGLALGNAVGSVIADTALIFGFGCVLVALPVDRFVLERQGWVQLGSAVLLALICYGEWAVRGSGAALERYVGAFLLALLAGYLWISVRWGKQHPGMSLAEAEEALEEVRAASWSGLATRFLAGLVLVIISSQVVVRCAEVLAVRWGMPPVVIASTIVAIGTSLPEFVIGITAVRRGHPELLIGNVIGADVLNILFVTGASAAAAPLPLLDREASVPAIFFYLHLPTMLAVLVLFRIFIWSAIRRGAFRRWFGVPLLAFYILYLGLNVLLGR